MEALVPKECGWRNKVPDRWPDGNIHPLNGQECGPGHRRGHEAERQSWELARCREPVWGTLPMAKVMRKEAQHTKRRDWASGVPLEILEHLSPKPESAYFTALCSHLHLWLYGGTVPHHLPLKKSLLIAPVNKVPGRDKSVSIYKLLWKSSSLPEQVLLATCDCSQPPNRERHEMF